MTLPEVTLLLLATRHATYLSTAMLQMMRRTCCRKPMHRDSKIAPSWNHVSHWSHCTMSWSAREHPVIMAWPKT